MCGACRATVAARTVNADQDTFDLVLQRQCRLHAASLASVVMHQWHELSKINSIQLKSKVQGEPTKLMRQART